MLLVCPESVQLTQLLHGAPSCATANEWGRAREQRPVSVASLACPKLLQVPAKGVPFPAKAKHRRLPLLALALVTLAPIRQFLDDQRSFLGCDGVPLLDVFDVEAVQILGVVEGVEKES